MLNLASGESNICPNIVVKICCRVSLEAYLESAYLYTFLPCFQVNGYSFVQNLRNLKTVIVRHDHNLSGITRDHVEIKLVTFAKSISFCKAQHVCCMHIIVSLKCVDFQIMTLQLRYLIGTLMNSFTCVYYNLK